MYDRKHFRVTLEGTNASDEDIWTTGWRIAPSPASEPIINYPAMANTLLDSVVAALPAFWTALRPSIANGTELRSVKVAPVDRDGRYIDNMDSVIHDLETPLSGGNGTAAHPPQVSVVASLTTGTRRGNATHGRMYLPLTGVKVNGTTFTIATNDRQTIANAVKGLLNDSLGTIADASLDPVVMSNIGSGTTRTITTIAVGSIPDTQRRRRNRFTEEYTIVSR